MECYALIYHSLIGWLGAVIGYMWVLSRSLADPVSFSCVGLLFLLSYVKYCFQ